MKKSRFTEEQMRKMTMAALLGAAFLFAPALCAAQAISPSGKPLSLPLATVPDNEAEDLAPLPKAAAPAIPAQATAVGQWVGVTAHQTDLVNQGGITGAGVKVCVIADGVDGLSGYQTSGDAPAVTIPSGFQGSGSTGTLMLLAIHQMAPNAQLAFASGQFGSLMSAINALKPLGCHVMVDAALFEPGRAFQLPFSATSAIDAVVAQGTTYITAAGDGGNAQSGTSGTYEGDFTPWTGTPPTGWANGTLFHSFNGRPYLTLDTATTSVSLEWDDPDGSPSMADYDLYVTDPTGTSLVAYGNNTQPTAQPVESTTCGVICHFAEGSRVYVVKYAGDARMLRIRTDSNRGTVTPSTTRAIQGHRAWPNAMTVAAVYPPTSCASYACQAPGFFQTPLSSDGYRQLFFTPHGQAFTPGNYLLGTGGGLGYIKPDIAAATSGAFNAPSPFFFNGSTAGAAASAAGLAALVKSAYPSAPVNFVRQALWINAFSFGFTVPNAGMGYGVTTAPVAVKNVLSPIVANNAYGPSFAAAGSIVQYDVSLTNPNQVTLTNVTYSDNLAAPIAASPNLITSGCAASVTANPGGTIVRHHEPHDPGGHDLQLSHQRTADDGGQRRRDAARVGEHTVRTRVVDFRREARDRGRGRDERRRRRVRLDRDHFQQPGWPASGLVDHRWRSRGHELGRGRRLGRCHAVVVPGHHRYRFRHGAHDRSRDRVHPPGRLAEPDRADGLAHFRELRRPGLRRAGLGRRALADGRSGARQQPRAARGADSAHDHLEDPPEHPARRGRRVDGHRDRGLEHHRDLGEPHADGRAP